MTLSSRISLMRPPSVYQKREAIGLKVLGSVHQAWYTFTSASLSRTESVFNVNSTSALG
jgi:hypothetical protein